MNAKSNIEDIGALVFLVIVCRTSGINTLLEFATLYLAKGYYFLQFRGLKISIMFSDNFATFTNHIDFFAAIIFAPSLYKQAG